MLFVVRLIDFVRPCIVMSLLSKRIQKSFVALLDGFRDRSCVWHVYQFIVNSMGNRLYYYLL